MKKMIGLLLVLPLGGCITDEPGHGELFMSAQQVSSKDDATCQSYGAAPGTGAYVNCRMQQEQLRGSANENRRRGLLGLSAAMMQPTPPPAAPVICNTHYMGNNAQTMCN